MTTNHEFETPRAALAHLLDTWGGEPGRWPARVRDQIDAISRALPEAPRLLAEARALDRLLAGAGDVPAPLPAARTAALADRIMAAAVAGPIPALPPAASAVRPSGNLVVFHPKRQPRPTPIPGWQAAGLIAASLMVGVYLGGSLNLAPLFQELAEVAGMSTVIDPTIAALGDDLNDEETL